MTGVDDMRLSIVGSTIALGFALGSAEAIAQPRMEQSSALRIAAELSGMQGVEPAPDTNGTAPSAQNPGGSASAGVYDGCNSNYVRGQLELPREPGYSIGTGCAHVSNEVDPKTQKELTTEPGYSIGTGSTRTSK
jgi:hypothetical protein